MLLFGAGILDQNATRLIGVNGEQDTIFPIGKDDTCPELKRKATRAY